MTTSPLFVTKRLELWRPARRDLEQCIAMVGRDDVARYLGPQQSADELFNRFLRNAGSWDLYGYGSCTVRERGADAVVGICGVFHSRRGLGDGYHDMAEAGWIIAPEYAGKGYATEAVRGTLDLLASTHPGTRVMCIIDPDNAPSLRVADNLGFAARGEREMPGGGTVKIFDRTCGG